jgi:hypothetical protein
MEKLTMLDQQVFNTFVKPGEIIEIRALNCRGNGESVWNGFARGTVSGYFDEYDKFCSSLRSLMAVADRHKNINIYMTLQVIDPNLLGRAYNKLIAAQTATSDKDVLFYRWLPIDLDPCRKSGISSSDEELEKARQVFEIIISHFHQSFPSPIKAMSGNGYHLLYPLSGLVSSLSAQSKENQATIKKILESLSSQFSTEDVKVDTTLYNPSRIIKLYGTTSYKGDSVPPGPYRIARPHRQSFISCLGDNK